MTAQLRFDGQVAVVTGAGRGLGRAYAHALAERGARVVVNDAGTDVFGEGADDRPAEVVAQEIAGAGGEAVANCDSVATESGAAAIVAAAFDRWGRIDVVVNNAGNLEPGALPELDADAVRRHLDIHVLGSFNVTRSAWPHLLDRRYGRVVVTTSVGMFGGEHLLSYSTAKGACVSLGRSLALSGAEHGIRVNMLAPAAETRMVTDPAFRERAGLPPLPDGGTADPERGPEHVVPLLLVLAHESCPANGETYGAGFGRYARIFWAETPGVIARGISAEDLLERFGELGETARFHVPGSSADSVRVREELLADAS